MNSVLSVVNMKPIQQSGTASGSQPLILRHDEHLTAGWLPSLTLSFENGNSTTESTESTEIPMEKFPFTGPAHGLSLGRCH